MDSQDPRGTQLPVCMLVTSHWGTYCIILMSFCFGVALYLYEHILHSRLIIALDHQRYCANSLYKSTAPTFKWYSCYRAMNILQYSSTCCADALLLLEIWLVCQGLPCDHGAWIQTNADRHQIIYTNTHTRTQNLVCALVHCITIQGNTFVDANSEIWSCLLKTSVSISSLSLSLSLSLGSFTLHVQLGLGWNVFQNGWDGSQLLRRFVPPPPHHHH